jgi:hypothetical protein
MSEDADTWATALGLPPEKATAFARLATAMGSSPADIIRMMIDRVIEVDTNLKQCGLTGGLAHWVSKETDRERARVMAAETAIEGLPLDIRPTEVIWPTDVPFPWSAEECLAAVLGYQVKWRGTADDILERLRGKWELSADGYALLWNP